MLEGCLKASCGRFAVLGGCLKAGCSGFALLEDVVFADVESEPPLGVPISTSFP